MLEKDKELPPIKSKSIQYGFYYDSLEANHPINIAAFGEISLIIDEENLQLEKVSLEPLRVIFEKQKTKWESITAKYDLKIDPFTLFVLYQVQRKVINVLDVVSTETAKRNKKLMDLNHRVNLSQMKGLSMCSEVSTLSAYILQKIGWNARLVIGSVITGEDKWRDAHAFVWIDDLAAIFDLTAVRDKNELPPIFLPEGDADWDDFENGIDIHAKRIGTNHAEFFGVEAGGFGVRTGDLDI